MSRPQVPGTAGRAEWGTGGSSRRYRVLVRAGLCIPCGLVSAWVVGVFVWSVFTSNVTGIQVVAVVVCIAATYGIWLAAGLLWPDRTILETAAQVRGGEGPLAVPGGGGVAGGGLTTTGMEGVWMVLDNGTVTVAGWVTGSTIGSDGTVTAVVHVGQGVSVTVKIAPGLIESHAGWVDGMFLVTSGMLDGPMVQAEGASLMAVSPPGGDELVLPGSGVDKAVAGSGWWHRSRDGGVV